MFGNGSLYLQVSHDRCLNCNICAISIECPARAFVQVPVSQPYLLRGKGANRP
jgi:electron transport complex protein RnfB